jgi:hypothetical protein
MTPDGRARLLALDGVVAEVGVHLNVLDALGDLAVVQHEGPKERVFQTPSAISCSAVVAVSS